MWAGAHAGQRLLILTFAVAFGCLGASNKAGRRRAVSVLLRRAASRGRARRLRGSLLGASLPSFIAVTLRQPLQAGALRRGGSPGFLCRFGCAKLACALGYVEMCPNWSRTVPNALLLRLIAPRAKLLLLASVLSR